MITYALLVFLLGLIFGSFINSLVYRLANKLSIMGWSWCPSCQSRLRPKDLIPLVSYLILKGKCRYCQKAIGLEYLLVEFVTGTIFLLIFLNHFAFSFFLVRDLFFAAVLIFIFLFDLKYYLILDKVIWPSLICALAINLLIGPAWMDIFMGLLIGWLFFFLQFILTRGKGIGFGDVKLGVLLGVMLGWQLVIVAIFCAYLIGGLVASILLIFKKKKFGDLLPLGVFLSAGAIIALLIGDTLISLLKL